VIGAVAGDIIGSVFEHDPIKIILRMQKTKYLGVGYQLRGVYPRG
jgi:hypothetical protein